MLEDPTFRREIYVAVIAAVVVMLVIEPLLRLTVNGVLWAGAYLYEGFANSVYRSAALGLREKFSFITLAVLFSIMSGLTAGITSALWWKGRPRISERSLLTRKYIALACVAFLFFAGFYMVGLNFADFQLNASFNQRLTVLAPNLSDQQQKELRARWAAMEKRSDYVAINSELESLATKHGVKLPKLLWE